MGHMTYLIFEPDPADSKFLRANSTQHQIIQKILRF
jgi:hypothetical protein